MTPEQLWKEYRMFDLEVPEEYEAWAFGDSKEAADELAKLVLEGKKTATASNHLLYELENEPLPKPGQYNIILDGDGNAVAIIKTISVEVVPFAEVTEEHAYLEGEGDQTLQYWRDVHVNFFKTELKGIGHDFTEKMLVVCERFQVVHKNM